MRKSKIQINPNEWEMIKIEWQKGRVGEIELASSGTAF